MRLPYLLGSALALGLATSVMAQPAAPREQPPPTPTYPYPPALYQSPDVAKSMKLTAEQLNRLNQITEQSQTRFRTNYDKLTPEERARQTRELNQQYHGDWMKGAREVFKDDQWERYQQLNLQYGGFNSLLDPDVQKRLNLTDQQRINLRESLDWSNQQMRDINKVGATDRDKGTQLYRDYQKEYQTRFTKFLTPEQQKTWVQMTGEAYNFQPIFVTPPR